MGPDQKRLRKRVRETIAALPDDELERMARGSKSEYTAYALRAAREELKKRKEAKLPCESASIFDDLSSDPVKASGCYIELWREKNYEGEYVCIQGPAQFPRLRSEAFDWSDSISSIRVGPKAFVQAFSEKDYADTMVCFGPNQEVPDLGEFKVDDQIDSLKVINSIRILDRIRLDGSAAVGETIEPLPDAPPEDATPSEPREA